MPKQYISSNAIEMTEDWLVNFNVLMATKAFLRYGENSWSVLFHFFQFSTSLSPIDNSEKDHVFGFLYAHDCVVSIWLPISLLLSYYRIKQLNEFLQTLDLSEKYLEFSLFHQKPLHNLSKYPSYLFKLSEISYYFKNDTGIMHHDYTRIVSVDTMKQSLSINT